MMTFSSKITKKGNFKVEPQVLEILGAAVGDTVVISVDKENVYKADELDCTECINIPQSILEAAGIDEENGLEVFAEDGRVIVQEIDDE